MTVCLIIFYRNKFLTLNVFHITHRYKIRLMRCALQPAFNLNKTVCCSVLAVMVYLSLLDRERCTVIAVALVGRDDFWLYKLSCTRLPLSA